MRQPEARVFRRQADNGLKPFYGMGRDGHNGLDMGEPHARLNVLFSQEQQLGHRVAIQQGLILSGHCVRPASMFDRCALVIPSLAASSFWPPRPSFATSCLTAAEKIFCNPGANATSKLVEVAYIQ